MLIIPIYLKLQNIFEHNKIIEYTDKKDNCNIQILFQYIYRILNQLVIKTLNILNQGKQKKLET